MVTKSMNYCQYFYPGGWERGVGKTTILHSFSRIYTKLLRKNYFLFHIILFLVIFKNDRFQCEEKSQQIANVQIDSI